MCKILQINRGPLASPSYFSAHMILKSRGWELKAPIGFKLKGPWLKFPPCRTSYVMLDELLNISEPRCPHL